MKNVCGSCSRQPRLNPNIFIRSCAKRQWNFTVHNKSSMAPPEGDTFDFLKALMRSNFISENQITKAIFKMLHLWVIKYLELYLRLPLHLCILSHREKKYFGSAYLLPWSAIQKEVPFRHCSAKPTNRWNRVTVVGQIV